MNTGTDTETDASENSIITLYPEQQAAKEKFLEWFEGQEEDFEDDPPENIFRIFGYAGTGKTTITREIIRNIKGRILFGAFTGKAALVMRRNDLPARTIHSLIYTPIRPDKHKADALRRKIDAGASAAEIKDLFKKLKAAEQMHFELNTEESDLNFASLFVLDECSMVNDEMKKDIQTFGVPLLVLGDPGQLPPIEGTGALVQDKPDVLLETIHRQALDNPIIAMSMKARTGQGIAHGEYGTSKKITPNMFKVNAAIAADQILTGKNVTRRKLNRWIREELGFFSDPYPVPGEKLICLRNNAKVGIFNGLLCTVEERLNDFDVSIEYKLKTEEGRQIICRILRAHFDEYHTPGTVKSLRWWDFQEAEEFDFGYAITVHKSQGSQWDHVILYDDKFFVWDKLNRSRWLYTAITRAAETITLVQG